MRDELLFEPSNSIDYTFDSMSSGDRSILDHFLLSEGLRDSVLNYSVIHDGDNLSYHDPIRISLDMIVGLSPPLVHSDNPVKKLAWRNAKQSSLPIVDEFLHL